jgi:hypothetical protein
MAAKKKSTKRRLKEVDVEESEQVTPADEMDPITERIKQRVAEALTDGSIQMKHPYEMVSRVHRAIDAALEEEPEEGSAEADTRDEEAAQEQEEQAS